MSDLASRLRDYAENGCRSWHGIADVFTAAADEIERQAQSIMTLCEIADELHDALADTFIGKHDFTTHCALSRAAIEKYRRLR